MDRPRRSSDLALRPKVAQRGRMVLSVECRIDVSTRNIALISAFRCWGRKRYPPVARRLQNGLGSPVVVKRMCVRSIARGREIGASGVRFGMGAAPEFHAPKE